MEKPAEFSYALVQRALEILDMTGVEGAHLWSDTGPHFRNYQYLASCGVELTWKYKINLVMSYGCECHLKSLADAKFATLNSAKDERAKSAPIPSIADLIDVYVEAAANQKACVPEGPDNHHEEFMAGPKESFRGRTFAKSSVRTQSMP